MWSSYVVFGACRRLTLLLIKACSERAAGVANNLRCLHLINSPCYTHITVLLQGACAFIWQGRLSIFSPADICPICAPCMQTKVCVMRAAHVCTRVCETIQMNTHSDKGRFGFSWVDWQPHGRRCFTQNTGGRSQTCKRDVLS